MANKTISQLPQQTDPAAKDDQIELETSGGTSRYTEHANLMRGPNYTVGSLPAVNVTSPGRLAYASNGRKVGEGLGSGTGTLVYDDGTAWRRVGDDTTVSS